ncbi:MAG TPA: hypothetical protein VJP77_00675 [Planctomycetota bacterium]|nr:hypothetical protein [Planctomycetota bacterium]
MANAEPVEPERPPEESPLRPPAPDSQSWLATLEQRLEVESVCQLVESMDRWSDLDRRLRRSLGGILDRLRTQDERIAALLGLLRESLLDLELVKRAAATAGHVGVLQRQQVEQALVREVFPPESPKASLLGVVVQTQANRPARVDCENRLHLCKAACCRIFSSALTPGEVASGRYEWEVKQPYALRRGATGCRYLSVGGCHCTIHPDRPRTCSNYSCEGDARIWKDFAAYELNPELAERLEHLHVDTAPASGAAAIPGVTLTPGTDPRARPLPREGAPTAVVESPAPAVAPPDFSELRARLPAQPRTKFVPGGPVPGGAAGSADGSA